jgi:hypothetical protein
MERRSAIKATAAPGGLFGFGCGKCELRAAWGKGLALTSHVRREYDGWSRDRWVPDVGDHGMPKWMHRWGPCARRGGEEIPRRFFLGRGGGGGGKVCEEGSSENGPLILRNLGLFVLSSNIEYMILYLYLNA